MKTIWIIDHYSSEPKYGGIVRQYDFAKELSKRGYNVVVIASSFSHFTHTYISDHEMFISKISENAHYVYLKTSEYQLNNGVSRFKNIISFERVVAKNRNKIAELFGKPDVISGCSVHPLAWVAAYRASKIYESKFIVEVRDLWPEIWIASGEKQAYHPMVVLFGLLEKWAYKKADRIIYSMPNGDKYINGVLGIPLDKMMLIGQPMDTVRFDNYAVNNSNLIPENILKFMEDSFICTFAGYFMDYEGVHNMLEAAKIIKDRNLPIKFLFVGSGQEEEHMFSFIKKYKLNNVMIGGRIRKDAIPPLLAKSSICMAHLAIRSNPSAYQYGVSKNKVNEYLYSGAPTIYGFHDRTDAVANSGAGYVIDPFDSLGFADTIEKIYRMEDGERTNFGNHGRKFIHNNYKVDVLVDKLIKNF